MHSHGQNIFCPCESVCYNEAIGHVVGYNLTTLSSDKFVVAYDDGESWDGKLRVGTIRNMRYLELGDPVTFFDGPSFQGVKLTRLTDDSFLLAYRTFEKTGCRICRITEYNNISIGPPVTLSYAFSPTVSISWNEFIIAFYDGATGYGKCAIGSANDEREIIIDSVYTFTTSSIPNDTYISIDTMSSNKFIIAYEGKYSGNVIMGTMGEDKTITFGNTYEYTTKETYNNKVLGLDNNTFAIVYADEYNVMKGTVILGTSDESNNIILSEKFFFNETPTRGITAARLTGKKIVVAYNNGGSNNFGYLVSGTVSGMNIEFAEKQLLNENVVTNSFNPIAATDSIHFLVQYIDQSDYKGYMTLCQSIHNTTDDSLTLCLEKSEITCHGETNGSIDLTVSGGYEPYTYIWSNGDTSEDISALGPGIYTVTVTDIIGTSSTNNIKITDPDPIVSDISIYNEISCPGGSNGAFLITAAGGKQPYTYHWDGHEPSSFYIAWGFYADTVYHVTIYDQNNCSSTDSASLSDPVGVINKDIYGDTDVVSGEFSEYYVEETLGSISNWIIEGGTILYNYTKEGNKIIKVQWGSTARGLISLVETYSGGCTSDTARLEVTIDTLNSFIEVDSLVDSRDGKVYKIVKIGGQWWMQENLNIGTIINRYNQSSTNNGVIEKFCLYNDTNKCEVYGGLYSWDEMMDYHGSDSALYGTTRGICPHGWHIPTDAEWKTLEMHLGLSREEADEINDRGELLGLACKLRYSGYLWGHGSDHYINESGFTALPAGRGIEINENYGDFCCENHDAFFWTSTKSLYNFNYARHISLNSIGVSRGAWDSNVDFSIRCISDSIPKMKTDFITNKMVCHGKNNGQIDIEITGGIGPYTYLWSTGETTRTVDNLSEGSYKVTISDSRGDIHTDSIELFETDPINTSHITGKSEVTANELSEYYVMNTPGSEYHWIIDGGKVILGQTTNQVYAKWGDPGSGTLSVVEMDRYGCTGDTVKLTASIGTGNIYSTKNDQILIYPNPADDRIYIRFPNPDLMDYDILITDLSGKVCRVLNDMNNQELIIHKGNLSSGLYFIEMKGSITYRGIIIFK